MLNFSIIVPVYNVEAYLRRCVTSLQAQTRTDYEVLLVDDGSTDASGGLCDEYAAADERFVTIHRTNGGLAAARNTGMAAARGKYLLFLDADDYLEKETLAKVYEAMESGQYELGSYAARRIDEREHFLYELRFDDMTGEHILTGQSKEAFLWHDFLQYRAGWEVCFHVFRRDLIERYALRFDETQVYAEDLPFTFAYLMHVQRYYKLPDILYNYTLRDTSISSRVTPEVMADAILRGAFGQMRAGLARREAYRLYGALLYYFRPRLLQGSTHGQLRDILAGAEHRRQLAALKHHKKWVCHIYGTEFYRFIVELTKRESRR